MGNPSVQVNFSWSGFYRTVVSMETITSLVFVVFEIVVRVPHNKLITNLTCSSRTVTIEFIRTSLRSVLTVKTSGRYSPSTALTLG